MMKKYNLLALCLMCLSILSCSNEVTQTEIKTASEPISDQKQVVSEPVGNVASDVLPLNASVVTSEPVTEDQDSVDPVLLNQNNPNETEDQAKKRAAFEAAAIDFCTKNGWVDNYIPQAYTVMWCVLPNDESIYFTDLYAHRNGKYKELIKKYKGIKTSESNRNNDDPEVALKPVIYLYPEQKSSINVRLDYDGDLTVVYPPYPKNGWAVTALPDGTLRNHADKKEYSYLFWEGVPEYKNYDMSKGFVVKGRDTATFLQEKLAYLGLTPKEYNEFIVFWLPKMQNNPYNLITFQGKAYTDHARLSISPKPDSVLRVFMVYRPLNESIEIPEQKLASFKRKGFTVIEWGGTEYSKPH